MNFSILKQHVTAKDTSYFTSLPKPEAVLNFLKCPNSQDTLLHVACRHESYEVLQYFITSLQADKEICNKDGKRPIHEAAQFSQEKCLQILLNNGAQINPLKRADWTPLMLACTKQNYSIITSLLDAGADPLLKNKDGWNSFHIACREGHLSIIQCLYSHSPSVSRTKSKNQRTPLHTAALHGHSEVVRWLLDACGCDFNVQDSCGVTPIMDALRAGYVDTARELMAATHTKTLLDLEDKIGRQAIHHASQNGQLTSLGFIITECGISAGVQSALSRETPLQAAAQEGHAGTLLMLLKLGADVNAQDNKGRSALHKASGGQHTECVRILLEHGAEQLCDRAGLTPQSFARKSDVQEVFKELGLCG